MNPEKNKQENCATCSQGKYSPPRFETTTTPDCSYPVVSLLETISTLTMANARATAELASLHAALIERTALPANNTTTTASTLPETGLSKIDGSGAGSTAIYQEIMKKNGHGRLGRTHMEDVDRLVETARSELDSYLRRTLHLMAPVGGGYCTPDPDKVFATLSTFGLRLEDRGPMTDVTVLDDSKNLDTATIRRLQSHCRHYYTGRTNKYTDYWKGSAIETLVELARYRGLFGADGFIIAAK